MENKANNFIKNEVLKMENRMFGGSILGSSIGYLLITLWLNSIRATTSLWFVWVLIIIQFALYFSIFIVGYRRSVVLGLNKNVAFILFIILAILGRINDWEIIVIPLLVVVMLAFSARNKKISEKGQNIMPENNAQESKMIDSELKHQCDMAGKLYKENPDLAMHIALGKEKATGDILPAIVYAKVCEEAERAVNAESKDSPEYFEKLEVCMKLANSDDNREISAEAHILKLRRSDQAIEAMKEVVNARIDAFEKTLPRGKTYKDHKKELVEEMEKSIDEQMQNPSEETVIEALSEAIDEVVNKKQEPK